MTPHPVPLSVRDAVMDLLNAAETLQDLRKDTTDRQLEQRWKANRVRREMSNG